MTHDAREKSHQDGEPVELYTFAREAVTWRYTSSRESVTFFAQTYEAATLSRSQIEHTSDKGRNSIKITCARDFEIAELFRVTAPTDVITVTIHRLHIGETEAAVAWQGRILNVDWSGASATMHCEPVSASLLRPGLRRIYSRQCPHVLYGSKCGLNKASFDVPVTLSAVSGTTLTSATFALYSAGHFSGGFIEFENTDGTIERRFITGHSGSAITVNIPLASLVAGSQITAYPGCDHNLTTCNDKFSNGLNYGGFPYVPSKNPFGGSSLF